MSATVAKIVDELVDLFPDVPPDFEFEGQTFQQRAEAWILHAIEELEEESGIDAIAS